MGTLSVPISTHPLSYPVVVRVVDTALEYDTFALPHYQLVWSTWVR